MRSIIVMQVTRVAGLASETIHRPPANQSAAVIIDAVIWAVRANGARETNAIPAGARIVAAAHVPGTPGSLSVAAAAAAQPAHAGKHSTAPTERIIVAEQNGAAQQTLLVAPAGQMTVADQNHVIRHLAMPVNYVSIELAAFRSVSTVNVFQAAVVVRR
jgi:hypothetical protein